MTPILPALLGSKACSETSMLACPTVSVQISEAVTTLAPCGRQLVNFTDAAEEEEEELYKLCQPTRLITCANHGDNVICFVNCLQQNKHCSV